MSEVEKTKKAEILRGPDLLKFLPLDTTLFDNVSTSGSNYSELSEQFSDVVYNVETEYKRKAKELVGKDLYTAFSFSPEFRKVIDQLKKEMIRENPNYVSIEKMIGVDPNEPQLKETESLKVPVFPDIDFDLEPKEDSQEEKKKDRKKPPWQEEEEESMFDTMSGYWRLLSVFDEFKISPPWHDAYAEGMEHWLSTRPISPEVLEHSRKKCLNWLSKYF